jgi:peptidoglycan/xylan/chitin deacetylase (PgdA/CDA1 family)
LTQADAMARRRVAFGGHGAEHLLLTQVSRPEAEAEIRLSKDVLDRRLNHWIPTFSYPNGYWTSEIADMVRAAGYRLAFITRRGFVSCDDDPFKIRRINVQENLAATTPMLLARILGLWGRHSPVEAQ